MLHRIGMFNHVRGWKMLQLLAEQSHDTVLGFLKSEPVADPGGDPRVPRIPLSVYSYVALVQLLAIAIYRFL